MISEPPKNQTRKKKKEYCSRIWNMCVNNTDLSVNILLCVWMWMAIKIFNYVLIRPISTEHKLFISSFKYQNKTPILWEAAPRPAHLFDDIAHPELSGFTTYACNTKHTISKIKDQGGREGDVTEMHAVLSSNRKTQKTLYMYTNSPNRSNRYSYSLGKNRNTCLKTLIAWFLILDFLNLI